MKHDFKIIGSWEYEDSNGDYITIVTLECTVCDWSHSIAYRDDFNEYVNSWAPPCDEMVVQRVLFK